MEGDDRATNSQKLVLIDSIDRREQRVDAIEGVCVWQKRHPNLRQPADGRERRKVVEAAEQV